MPVGSPGRPRSTCLGWGGAGPLAPLLRAFPCGCGCGPHSLSLRREPPAGPWMAPGSTEVHTGRIQTGAGRKWGALQGPGGCGRPFPEAHRSLQGQPGFLQGRGGRTGRLTDPQACRPLGPRSPLPPQHPSCPLAGNPMLGAQMRHCPHPPPHPNSPAGALNGWDLLQGSVLHHRR